MQVLFHNRFIIPHLLAGGQPAPPKPSFLLL
jgi:hypothetical protein